MLVTSIIALTLSFTALIISIAAIENKGSNDIKIIYDQNKSSAKWLILKEKGDFNYGRYQCSNCNHVYLFSYKYCPYCGRKMHLKSDEVEGVNSVNIL